MAESQGLPWAVDPSAALSWKLEPLLGAGVMSGAGGVCVCVLGWGVGVKSQSGSTP